MVVSFCCGAPIIVQGTENSSYYVCAKCKLPSEGRRAQLKKKSGDKEKTNADIQPKVD